MSNLYKEVYKSKKQHCAKMFYRGELHQEYWFYTKTQAQSWMRDKVQLTPEAKRHFIHFEVPSLNKKNYTNW